ncbi:MAG: hypothetical protein WCT28_03420 [Patescibacteria group bacterium]|jgi:hypothetical protein
MNAAQGGGGAGLLWEIGGDVLRFPLWWYSTGLQETVLRIVAFVQGYAQSIGFMVWVKNIFTPMFGRYDWQSRLISVLVRCVNIVARGFAVCILGIFGVGLCALYALLPIVAAFFVVYHASSFFSL